jgi:hypothetical protein
VVCILVRVAVVRGADDSIPILSVYSGDFSSHDTDVINNNPLKWSSRIAVLSAFTLTV